MNKWVDYKLNTALAMELMAQTREKKQKNDYTLLEFCKEADKVLLKKGR